MEWQADGTSSEGRHWGAGKRPSTEHLSEDVPRPSGQRRAAHQKLPGEVIGQACLVRRHAHQPDRCVHAHMHLSADTEGNTVLCHRCPWFSHYRSPVAGNILDHLTQLGNQGDCDETCRRQGRPHRAVHRLLYGNRKIRRLIPYHARPHRPTRHSPSETRSICLEAGHQSRA